MLVFPLARRPELSLLIRAFSRCSTASASLGRNIQEGLPSLWLLWEILGFGPSHVSAIELKASPQGRKAGPDRASLRVGDLKNIRECHGVKRNPYARFQADSRCCVRYFTVAFGYRFSIGECSIKSVDSIQDASAEGNRNRHGIRILGQPVKHRNLQVVELGRVSFCVSVLVFGS